jgi:pimeloyl-ACP methyl ester carboxylesterase
MVERTAGGTAYETFGASGPAVVLVHGLGLNRHSWQWQVPALSGRYRVITIDLYGHGDSEAPPSPPSLSLFSGQIEQVISRLGISRAAVAGFSLGGMIARRFAMDHVDRLWALAILHSAHRRDQKAHDAIQARVNQARADGPAATVGAALERWFTAAYRASHPEVMEQVRQWILANRKEIYAPIYQVLVDGVAELISPSPSITVPTLVMTGDEDHGNSPEMSRAIAAEISGARLVILPGLRHMALAEAPELFNRHLLSFLDAASRHD